MRSPRLALAAVALVALVAAPAASPGASSLPTWAWFKHLGTSCATGTQTRVTVSYRMGVANKGFLSRWVSNMRLSIRPENPGAGLQGLSHQWRTVRYPAAGMQGRSYVADLKVTSDGESPNQDKIYHVKLIWDRKAPYADLVQDLKFRPQRCKGVSTQAPPVGVG